MKYTIEMSYGLNVSVIVDAKNKGEAVFKAKELIEKNKSKYVDIDNLEFDQVTFISERD